MEDRLSRRAALTVPLLLVTTRLFAAPPAAFVVTIARKHMGSDCTSGYLAVNGSIIAYTLELPFQGNAPLISAIPNGSYDGFLRYDHPDRWRIELKNVPGRGNVQIHTGNTVADSEGCILVGSALNAELCGVTGSKAAYDALRTAFYGSPNPVATPDKTITVKVES